jgi:hypothetical protein
MGVIMGIALLAISVVAFYIAIPRDGHIVRFLRSDTLQSLYTTGILVAFYLGAVFLVIGLAGVDQLAPAE